MPRYFGAFLYSCEDNRITLNKRERFRLFINYFSEKQPDTGTELVYSDPYQLLVAVILSAQCTDKRVNLITPEFFKRFPNARSLAKARNEDVFEIIKSCSYPNNKTRNLIGMAATLINEFKGLVPSNVSELLKLPGVGRKTANVVASVVFNKPVLAVDTHVFRVSARLGLTTNARTPLAAEKQLIKYIPQKKISLAHHWLVIHGRYICTARNPKCGICDLKTFCKFYQQNFR